MSRRPEATPETPNALRDPRVSQLLHACGDHFEMMVNHVAMVHFSGDASYKILKTQLEDQRFNIFHMSHRALHRALLTRHVDCRCSSFEGLEIKNIVSSGSTAEGVHTPAHPPKYQSSSDADFMIELGPVNWTFPERDKISIESITAEPPPVHAAGGTANHGRDSLPRLLITETDNPGFVLLLQERRDDCSHPARLPFNAEDIREFITDYQLLIDSDSTTKYSNRGPASSSFRQTDLVFVATEADYVPCLRVPVWWIPDEFFTRPRRFNWLREDVKENIRHFGIHLVPVGAPGSKTERIEWRLSFSRAEVLIACLLTVIQRCTIIAFKECKIALGQKGKVIKSYFVKTAMLWLCEQIPGEAWASVTWGIGKLLDFLEEAVGKANLPCFFWSRINLFRFTNREDRRAMKEALRNMRKHLPRLLAHVVSSIRPEIAARIGARRLTERQLRVRLTRCLIVTCLGESIRTYTNVTTADSLNKIFPVVLRTYSPAEVSILFRRLSHRHVLQKFLYHALLVAPADVASQVRLSASGDGGFLLDAAPLMALLTEDDLKDLLGDPDAVRAWLRCQHEKMASLPADLRSPRDLCDLLLNTRFLCRTLSDSVPKQWMEWNKRAVELQLLVTKFGSILGAVIAISICSQLRNWKLVANLELKLAMDHQTATQIGRRYEVEAQRLMNDVGARKEFTELCSALPDFWNIWRFALARSS